MTDFLKELQSKPLLERLGFLAYKLSGKGYYEEAASDVMFEASKKIIELEDEISIWRSFMVPEPVVREAAQEPVCARRVYRQAVRDVSREAERRMYVRRILELEAKVEELQWGT